MPSASTLPSVFLAKLCFRQCKIGEGPSICLKIYEVNESKLYFFISLKFVARVLHLKQVSLDSIRHLS